MSPEKIRFLTTKWTQFYITNIHLLMVYWAYYVCHHNRPGGHKKEQGSPKPQGDHNLVSKTSRFMWHIFMEFLLYARHLGDILVNKTSKKPCSYGAYSPEGRKRINNSNDK